MSLYRASAPQLSKMLTRLLAWLDEAEALAAAKKFDPAVLLAARLAPDQYPLTKQIQAACDAAKFAAARLAGKEPPKHPDTETTLAELRARVSSVVEYLGTFREEDFTGAADRLVALPFLPGKALAGRDYLNQMALPNFYFHLVTAYAILRHNGVALGKITFLGEMPLVDL